MPYYLISYDIDTDVKQRLLDAFFDKQEKTGLAFKPVNNLWIYESLCINTEDLLEEIKQETKGDLVGCKIIVFPCPMSWDFHNISDKAEKRLEEISVKNFILSAYPKTGHR